MKTSEHRPYFVQKANIQLYSEDSSEKENMSSTLNQNDDSYSGPYLNVNFSENDIENLLFYRNWLLPVKEQINLLLLKAMIFLIQTSMMKLKLLLKAQWRIKRIRWEI